MTSRRLAVGALAAGLLLGLGCEPPAEEEDAGSGSDAGVQADAGGSDAAASDSARPDSAQPDGARPDGARPDSAQPQEVFWLTLLHGNDGESALVSTDVFGGVARFAARVDELRTAALAYQPTVAPNEVVSVGVATVSSGDNFLAGPQFNASLENGVPYYDSMAIDAIGYDAVCLGNHDFDFGPEVLDSFISGTGLDVVFLAANVDFSGEPALAALVSAGRIAGRTVLETGGQQVGVVGALTEELSYISSPRNVTVGDVATAVQAEVDALTSAGVNKVVLISHLQSIEEDLALIPQLHGVDLAVAGGGDELLANAGNQLIPDDAEAVWGAYPQWVGDADSVPVPVVTTMGQYRYVGRLVAKFDAAGALLGLDQDLSGPVRVAGAPEADAVTPDATLLAEVEAPVQAALDALASNTVAHTEVPLDGTGGNIRTRETNEGNLIADALLWQATELAATLGTPVPDVALHNSGGIRNFSEIPVGPVTELDTFSMLPYANFVTVVEGVDRARFKALLENAVAQVERYSGRFAHVAGFRFTWDPGGQPRTFDDLGVVVEQGARVLEAVLDDGTVVIEDGAVVDGDPIVVATVDFLARGGDQYPLRNLAVTNLGVSCQQALLSYLRDGLSGTVTAAMYPAGGEGRIERVGLWLTLLHINGGESALLPSGDFGGVARLATLLDDLEAAALVYSPGAADTSVHKTGVALLSAGDAIVSGKVLNASIANGVPFYESQALDAMGFDALALGNHEFDLGPELLADFISGFSGGAPFVATNLDFAAEASLQALVDGGQLAPSAVIQVAGERVGVVAVVTEELPYISSPRAVVVSEAAAAAQDAIDELAGQGVNKIVLLSHMHEWDQDLALVTEVSGVDLVVAGGGYTLLANDGDLLVPGDEDAVWGAYPVYATDSRGHQVPVVTTKGGYKYVGKLVVKFDGYGALVAVDGDASGAVRVAGGAEADAVAPDATLQTAVEDPVQAAVDALASNTIAHSEVALDGTGEHIRVQETNEGNLIADALLWQATQLAAAYGAPTPVVALQTSGSIRNFSLIPAGDLSEGDTFDMLPFPSFVSIVSDVSRGTLKAALENSVSMVETFNGRFAHVAGLSFTWDAAETARALDENGAVVEAGSRIRQVALDDGTVIVQDGAVVAGDPVAIATIDFTARGGDQYPFEDLTAYNLGVSYQQALLAYLVEALSGEVTAAMYPEGGEGRITRQN